MKLEVTDHAASWLKGHLGLHEGDQLAFVAEKGPAGIKVKYQVPTEPGQAVAKVVKAGVTYYIDFNDEWYFSGKVTTVDYEKQRGISYHFAAENDDLKIVKGNVVQADSTTAASRAFEDFWE